MLMLGEEDAVFGVLSHSNNPAQAVWTTMSLLAQGCSPLFSPPPRPVVGIPRIVTCMGAEVTIGQ